MIHYVGLSKWGKLLYTRQWWSYGLGYMTQDKFDGSLVFVGEPLITRKSHTELDIWAISSSARLFRRSYNGIYPEGSWSEEWEDLGEYNSRSKPAVAYDAANNTYIMGLNPKDRDTYVYKVHNPRTGWSPSNTTWIPSIYTNWLSPPTISTYNDGNTRGSDVHVWGINKNGKLYYSYSRNGQWWPSPFYYYEIMNVPGIVTSGSAESNTDVQKLLAQDELR
ncbi:hypothetical protein NHQ30_011535 [Ciborinia camelliae]|nr:hypothetical protein NHQ30_011535 [Ciborinia camelliae]